MPFSVEWAFTPTRFQAALECATRGQQVPTLPNTAFRQKQRFAVKAIPKRTRETRSPNPRRVGIHAHAFQAAFRRGNARAA